MRKGSLTSKSLGDLPEFQEDSRIKKKPAAAGWSEDFDDHWTDNAGPSRANKDDDDEEYLPEPETKTSRSFNLFGSKKGVVTAEGERLRGTRYGAVDGKTPTIEEDLDDSAFASPNTRRRERSSSLGGRLKSAFSVFSAKYEAITQGNSTATLLAAGDNAPIQTDNVTKFSAVHYKRIERNVKRPEEATVAVVFSPSGAFLEEQPSGDYIDDISPSVVTKYLLDPKNESFNLMVCRKGRYSATQLEYTVVLTSKYCDLMYSCWRDIVKGTEPITPRDEVLSSGGLDAYSPTKTREKEKVPALSFSPGRTNPFEESDEEEDSDDEFSPRNTRGKNRPKVSPRGKSSSGPIPSTMAVSPPRQQQQQSFSPPPKKDLLIDV